MREIPLTEVKDDLSRLLRLAEDEQIIITRHGKPAGVLIGFKDEDDWFDYRLEHDERFLKRIDNPDKNWKLNTADIEERQLWSDYMKAYEACLSATSTANAPRNVVPAGDKRTPG